MNARTEVFVSATICKLRSDRQEVKNTRLTLGIFPYERNGLLGILFLVASFGLTARLLLRFGPRTALVLDPQPFLISFVAIRLYLLC
jgi:hypothetical protein